MGPWSCNLERASAGERPDVSEVCSRSAVSLGVRLENWSAIDYPVVSLQSSTLRKTPTLATDEVDRLCLVRDLDLFLDRGRDAGSELAESKVGRFVNGNTEPPAPGLADRERRGQGMASLPLPLPFV